jgi:hypothetical protein
MLSGSQQKRSVSPKMSTVKQESGSNKGTRSNITMSQQVLKTMSDQEETARSNHRRSSASDAAKAIPDHIRDSGNNSQGLNRLSSFRHEAQKFPVQTSSNESNIFAEMTAELLKNYKEG